MLVYSWEDKGSGCDKNWTFCWRGPEDVSDPQVMAWGTRWTTQDKEEHPFEWITEVRCLKNHKLCIVARNQKVPIGSGTMTYSFVAAVAKKKRAKRSGAAKRPNTPRKNYPHPNLTFFYARQFSVTIIHASA